MAQEKESGKGLVQVQPALIDGRARAAVPAFLKAAPQLQKDLESRRLMPIGAEQVALQQVTVVRARRSPAGMVDVFSALTDLATEGQVRTGIAPEWKVVEPIGPVEGRIGRSGLGEGCGVGLGLG